MVTLKEQAPCCRVGTAARSGFVSTELCFASKAGRVKIERDNSHVDEGICYCFTASLNIIDAMCLLWSEDLQRSSWRDGTKYSVRTHLYLLACTWGLIMGCGVVP